MKRKLLHLSLLTIVLGLAGLIIASGYSGVSSTGEDKTDDYGVLQAADYLHQMRSNQVTGEIDPADVLAARLQAEQGHFKSGNAIGLEWIEMGPDNAPGRVRALIFDKNDETRKTLIAASVTGGLWKTTNLGSTWNKINLENQNLYVSYLAQTSDGSAIYAGTGEAFCTEEDTYYGGQVGQGLFKSTDGDTFTLVPETAPEIAAQNDTVDWAYINKITIHGSRVYVATNTGLFYSDNGNDNWLKANEYYHDTMTYNVSIAIDSTVMCDAFEVVGNEIIMENPQLNSAEVVETSYEKVAQPPMRTVMEFGKVSCTDVAVGNDGTVVATFKDMVYIAPGGNDMVFTNKSGTPSNPNLITREDRDFATTLIAVDTLGNTASRTVNFEEMTDYVPDPADGRPSPLAVSGSTFPDRAKVAFAPSDETGDIIYAVSTQGGFLYNAYLSEDKGETWQIIMPGGSNTLTPFDGTACFNNVFEVFPNDPYKVLLGGQFMWLGQRIGGTTGYFDWGLGPITAFLPVGHHIYAFQPGSSSKLAVATNRGVYYGSVGSGTAEFNGINRNLAITQSYTVGITGLRQKVVTGTQGDGNWYVSGEGNTEKAGTKFDFATGGSVLISLINPEAFVYSNSTGAIERSEDEGANTSFNFEAPSSNLFITPMSLWESFDSENSRDSVTFINNNDTTYRQGDVLIMRSANRGFDLDTGYPFTYVLEQDSLVKGDSIRVKDIIQAKLFVATHNTVYLTKDVIRFDKDTDWWQIATVQTAYGQPSCMAYSSDADYLFVGTSTGKIIRISNIALAYDYDRADLRSPFSIIATDLIEIPEFDGRFITSIAVDQNNPENILVTLGNYGNEEYVYKSNNALASPVANVQFSDITANLPKMPVYSSVIEMNDSNIAIIGTEYGVYTTSNLQSGDIEWAADNSGVGIIPVFQLKQQTVFKDRFVLESDDPGIPPLVYYRVNNWGDIYMATYGRGIFRTEAFHVVGVDEPIDNAKTLVTDVVIYPNPVSERANIAFTLQHQANVVVSVYNLSGMLVKEYTPGRLQSGLHEMQVDCSKMTTGGYVVMVRAGNEVFSSKFIVR
jgi:photosystem II stability/assembly factor-like uncharacterized protein